MSSTAPVTIDRSGSRCLVSGVGSAIRIASASRSSSWSLVARTRPRSTSGASTPSGTSSMWLRPALTASTTRCSTSTSSTLQPASANTWASGKPT
jgi:hypothetical protein